MIKITDAVFPSQEQLNAIILGARHPMNSEAKSDTIIENNSNEYPVFGEADYGLAKRLATAGKENRSHCKYLRMMEVIVTVTAPMYWYKEMDTYKVGTVRNSSSTMHKIESKEFTLGDFSVEHLIEGLSRIDCPLLANPNNYGENYSPLTLFTMYIIPSLNAARKQYLKTKDKFFWWCMIQSLPSSYNQTSTFSLNYETLHKIYIDRKDHKLDEWRDFCKWIKTIPMADLIVPAEDLE